MNTNIQRFLNSNPRLYEPDLLKKIDLLQKWLDFDHSKKLTLHPSHAIQIAKHLTIPPKRPFLKSFIPNWKLRLARWLAGHQQLSIRI